MSIQNQIDMAAPGSTVNVSPGTYNEQLVINKPLVLTGPPPEGGAAVIDAAGLGNIPTIQILSNDVTVKRLHIKNGPLHGIVAGDVTFPNLSNIIISDNYIENHGNAGILTNFGAALVIKNNVIANNGQGAGFNRTGIVLYPHGETVIADNTIVNNTVEGIFARGSSSGLLIENNQIKNSANSGITLSNESNTSIMNNIIINCGAGNYDEEGGIVISQAMAEVIRGNTIKDCKPSGIFWGWVPTTGSPPAEILIEGNTIDNSSRDAIYLFSQGPGGFIPPDIYPLEPIIKGNNLRGSARAGVYVSNYYYYSPGNAKPTINDNDIVGNDWGVFNATAQVDDATNNWWGNESGPFHPTLNPGGTGDPVSNNVDFIPWKKTPMAIKITGCSVKTVSLERYSIVPSDEGGPGITLVVQVTGEVFLSINGNRVVKNFSTWFVQSMGMPIPQTGAFVPEITATSTCYAFLNDDFIQVEVDLCLVVSILGGCVLRIPSYGICPISERVNGLKPKKGFIKPSHPRPKFRECINTEKVFASCWFKKNLTISIGL